jgi:hypothetical protein
VRPNEPETNSEIRAALKTQNAKPKKMSEKK